MSKLIKIDTQEYPVSIAEFKNRHSNIAFPRSIPFSDFGYEVVFTVPKPAVTDIQQVVEGTPALNGLGKYAQTWNIVSKFSDTTDEFDVVTTQAEHEAAFAIDQLATDKYTQKQVIKQAFDEEVLIGFVTTSGHNMDLDPTLLKAGYDLSVQMGETDMTVRDFDNVSHVLPIADVSTIVGELSIAWRILWTKKVTLQDSIDIESNIDSILLVVW